MVRGGIIRYDAGVLNADVGACAERLMLNFAGKDLPTAFEASGLTAASGRGTVWVDVGDAKLKSGDRVVTWATERPTENVRFRMSNGMRAALLADDTGLVYRVGFAVFLR